MSTWKDKLQTASFRGVEFGVKDTQFQGGRRAAIHEFPKRETPYTQDLGRKAKEFTINGFVVGEAYFGRRDKLINALDKEGTGELIHPYYGRIKVQVTGFSARESFDGGGMVEFSMSFAQSEKIQFQAVESENGIAIGEALINDLFGNLSDLFELKFDTSGISFYLNAVVGTVRALTKLGKKLLQPIAQIAGVLDDVASGFNIITVDIRSLATQPISLLNALTNPFKKITGGLGQLDRIGASYSRLNTGNRQIDTSRIIAIKYATRLFSQSNIKNTAPSSATSSARVSLNDTLINTAYQIGSVALAADSLLTAPYDTLADALNDKNLVMDQIDSLLESIQTIPDHESLYQALIDLKIHLYKSVPGDGASTRTVASYQFPGQLSSLEASWALFGSLANETDIINRNMIRNPALIPGQDGVRYVA